MKTKLLFILLISLLTKGFSQKLLFTSEFGGDNSNGSIVSYDLNSNTTSNQLSLEGNPLYGFNLLLETAFGTDEYNGGLTLGSDGKYYGVNTSTSGNRSAAYYPARRSRGAFYSYDPTTGKVDVLHSFIGNQEWHSDLLVPSDAFDNDLNAPGYTALEASPGVFYGIALMGGVANRGGIWKFDTNTGEYKMIGSFKDPLNDVGHLPITALIKGDGNNIYGLCRKNSNATNNEEGYLYKIDTSTDQLSYVDALNAAGWVMAHAHGQMVYNPSINTIYGTKDRFNATSNWGGGVWSYNLTTNTQVNEWSILFTELAILGSEPAGIVQANDAKMYVTTRFGGAHNTGTIIQYNTGTGAYLKVFDFPVGFAFASGTGMQVSGSKIFGTCSFSTDATQMWSYDYTTNIFEIILTGDETDPTKPGYNTEFGILVDNGNIIGSTRNGSEGGAGAIFSHNIATGQNTILKSHGSREGRTIIGELTQLNETTFIGYIGKGGPNTAGNPVAQNEHGSLALFNVVTGTVQYLEDPFAAHLNDEYAQSQWMNRPLLASNGNVYYTTYSTNGPFNDLSLMEHDLTNPAQRIHDYTSSITEIKVTPGVIELPSQKIVMAAVNNVEVYDLNTATLTSFTNTHSTNQYGHMTDNIMLASNGRIYGMTDASVLGTGAGENRAVIYSLDTTTFTFQVEHIFESDVRTTNSILTEYNGKLYGSTNFLGSNNHGHLFSYDMTTNVYSIEYSFDRDQDGGGFSAGWTLYNDKLYSTSRTGGMNGYGTLVVFDLTNSTLSVLEHLTMENGRSFRGTPIVWDDSALGVNDLNSDSFSINVYPNPVKRTVTVDVENVSLIEIYSLTGQLVKSIKNSKTVNVEDINTGILIIKVYNDKGIYSSKFIKE